MDPHQYRNLFYKPDMNICDLPAKLMLDLRESLDTGPETKNWRALLNIASKNFDHYNFSYQEVEEKFGNRIHQQNGSPARSVILELGARGMTVEELVFVLDHLKLEKILMYLKKYEKIKILCQPAETTYIKENDKVCLEVEAVGFPYPRYQWFKFSDISESYTEINGANLSVYKVDKAKVSDSGTYCCRLHNGQGDSQVHFSEEAVVIVEKNPVTTDDRAVNHDRLHPIDRCKNQTDFYRQHDIDPEKARLPYILEHPRCTQLTLGDTLVLNCVSLGQVPLVYEWYKDRRPYGQSHDSFIKIPGVLLSHSGVYKCIVRNTFGEQHSDDAIVTVTEIEIISNPKTCTVEFGGNAVFTCEARCRGEQLRYKWFKDGVELPGETKCELRLYNLQDMDKQGVYQCSVIAPSSHRQRLTNPATLSIKYNPLRPPEFNPTDKVALLIGNYDYIHESKLKAPKADVLTMSEIFRSLDFKVVSLLNLTKTEMLSAVDEFSELLGREVYGVFYFCGHGFEEDGRCYLVPPDARAGYTIDDCVCAEKVLQRMQKPDPALTVLILDICRIRNRVPSPKPEILDFTQKGNTVFCYATSEGMYAYENSENGILVQYLQRFLLQHKGLVEIFSQLQEDIGKEPKHYKLQIPEVRSNLLEPRRSLADRISFKGNTVMYNKRTLKWLRAHQKPEKQLIEIPDLLMLIELEFQSEFSNVLHVITTVKRNGVTAKAIGYIGHLPSSVSTLDEQPKIISTNPMRTKTTLYDMQKLTDDLWISVQIRYNKVLDNGQLSPDLCHDKTRVNLKLPLVAVLMLWKLRGSEAMEHEENDYKYTGLSSASSMTNSM
ncbi:hypothetical protein FSP39_025389 [Pinctada imbricata]|uniref:Mucosa-associated lymphoid tissue lymphoma translocation protein 1 n=1 Tax=Pinctada imbricata TaxID=66713 RepID=A0AA88Y714_PINIB|nr:hypothetical protein FSP39_025389 [Pinctada imbricata]